MEITICFCIVCSVYCLLLRLISTIKLFFFRELLTTNALSEKNKLESERSRLKEEERRLKQELNFRQQELSSLGKLYQVFKDLILCRDYYWHAVLFLLFMMYINMHCCKYVRLLLYC